METLVVVQARMGSTRLPGKVLADLGGTTALGLMLDRLARLDVGLVVVATTEHHRDEPVVKLAEARGAAVIRGSEADVLERFGHALDRFPADHVVRLTADCPLVDPDIVAGVLALHQRAGVDYTSNTLERTFPDGLDVEVVTAAALREAVAEATLPVEREHVTPFVYTRASRYRLASLSTAADLGRERWTLDTPGDLARLRAIVAALDDPITARWRDVLAVAGVQFPVGVVPAPTGVTFVAEHLLPA